MALSCPFCQKPLTLQMTSLEEETGLLCQNCNKRLRLQLTVTPWPEVAKTDSKKILVAVEGEATHEMILEILSESGFEVINALDGKQALEVIERFHPQVSILDVGLPHLFGSAMPEILLKRDTFPEQRIILLSSINDKAIYKRKPDSLYGADDYIERHHIHDQLLNKVLKLIEPPKKITPSTPSTPTTPEIASHKPSMPEKRVAIAGELTAHDAAKRLARIIIADIALYNQKRVEEGLRNNTFHELLKDELEEGLRLYRSRTPKEIVEMTHYFEEVLADFIQKQNAKLRSY